MMNPLYFIPIGILLIWLLWVFYLAVMSLKKVLDSQGLPVEVRYPGMIVLFLGLIIDLIVNVFIASIIFLDLPRKLTVTGRLQRYIEQGTGWRYKIAHWFCIRYLNPFDPSGNHCD